MFLRKENVVYTILELVSHQSSAQKLVKLEAVACTMHFFQTEELPASGKIAEALKRCISLVPFTLIEPGPQNRIGSSMMLSQKVVYSRFSTLLKTNRRWSWSSTIQFFLRVADSFLPCRKRSNCLSPAWKSANPLSSSITVTVRLLFFFSFSQKSWQKKDKRNSCISKFGSWGPYVFALQGECIIL